jgi:protein involved in polysaccharide export with SLBB domain
MTVLHSHSLPIRPRSSRYLLAGICLFLATAAASAQPVDSGTFTTTNSIRAAGTKPAGAAEAQAEPKAARGAPATKLTAANTPPLQPDKALTLPLVRSEFQKYVEASTGRMLPVFGAKFFADTGDSFAPVDNVPVSADYALGPGDEILIRAWGSLDVDYRTTVDRNGLLNLPRVGSFSVAGVKASALESHLRAQIGRLYTNFNLSATLGQLRGVRVFVVGPAAKSGVYNLASQATLLSAVVAAGGPAANGSMRKVSLRRDGRIISTLDIYEFLVQGDKAQDVQLAAGDVVVFQPVGPRAAVVGATELTAIFELKSEQEPLREILRYAGGASVLASRSRVQLERIDPKQLRARRFVEDFALDEAGLQKPLRDGDVLTFFGISPEFANAVTLRGHVAQPIRSAWRPGMRIRDLIPDKEALITPGFYNRKNMLVQVFEPNASAASPAVRAEPSILFDELNWEYAVVERLNNADLTTSIIPFNLGRVVLKGDDSQNIELLAGDVVTVYGQKDLRVPLSRQTRLVSLEGEVATPGVYQLAPGETLPALITRAGGFTAQAYVYGLEFSRLETRERQRENLAAASARLEALAATQSARLAANRREDTSAASTNATVSAAATQAQLARLASVQPNGRIALELDPTTAALANLPDLPLEHGDRISVPSRPAFVTVSGAVVNSNAFIWKPGRRAGDYIKLAGLDEGAEVSNMFILRADGTVAHAHGSVGWLGMAGGLQSQAMYPGDAVVVPSQLDFETWGNALVRNLKDWSQIFSQFGLGAAAIKTLR